MSQIASLLTSNQSVFVSNPLLNFTPESNKELPRWLLEFDSFTREDTSPLECKQVRPLTESHLRNRPKWFEELSQRRRLSEIPAMETDETSEGSQTASPPSLSHLETMSIRPENPVRVYISSEDLNEQENSAKLPTERKYSSEWRFLQQNGDSPGKATHSASSDGSKHSYLADANSLEQDIFSLTTSRSIEKLRISELVTPLLEECIIPEMPHGSELTLTMLANWGDEHFIGINGLEILSPHGRRPTVKNIYLTDSANKRHELSDLGKLLDSVYRTHDDSHIWQYRVRREQLPLQIVIQLAEPITIALLRIWNYNKSRIHSYRGVKFLQIKLSGQLIFSGEVAKASGELSGSVENFGDTILFTTNEAILENISNFDISFQELLMEQFQQVAHKF